MSIKCAEKEIKIINVTFDVFNGKGTATREDGLTFEIDYITYDAMLWDIKRFGYHAIIEKDYSGNSFQDLMNAL